MSNVQIRFGFEIVIECEHPVPMLLALAPRPDIDLHLIGSDEIHAEPDVPLEIYFDAFGNQFARIVAPVGGLTLWSDCIAQVDGRPDPVNVEARLAPVQDLPVETLQFLAPSRYCESDELGDFAWDYFGFYTPGWQQVQAICDYVHEQTTFDYKFGRPTKTAHEVHTEKSGVCRDFAHLAISLCRAMNIPARYVSGYISDISAPETGPTDFCAWFEVFLDGAWHTFDARHNKPRVGRVQMVRGRDAADVAIITSFGSYDLTHFRVWTMGLPPGSDDNTLLESLRTRPDTPALVFPSSAMIED